MYSYVHVYMYLLIATPYMQFRLYCKCQILYIQFLGGGEEGGRLHAPPPPPPPPPPPENDLAPEVCLAE